MEKIYLSPNIFVIKNQYYYEDDLTKKYKNK